MVKRKKHKRWRGIIYAVVIYHDAFVVHDYIECKARSNYMFAAGITHPDYYGKLMVDDNGTVTCQYETWE